MVCQTSSVFAHMFEPNVRSHSRDSIKISINHIVSRPPSKVIQLVFATREGSRSMYTSIALFYISIVQVSLHVPLQGH